MDGVNTQTGTRKVTAPTAANMVCGLGLAAGGAAFVGSSCCVLPLLLAMAGAGGSAIAGLAVFAAHREILAATALIATALGWAIAFRRNATRAAMVMLGLATLMTAGALLMSTIEPRIVRQVVGLWQAR